MSYETIPLASDGSPPAEAADEHGVDLVVMGTHGRSGLERVVVGSVAEDVVRNAEVPVVTVRSDGSSASVDREAL